MSKQQDRAELREIVNRAVVRYDESKYDDLKEEIAKYQSAYFQKKAAQKERKTAKDTSFLHDLMLAVDFCEMLEAYRVSMDPYRDEPEPISEKMAMNFTQKIDEVEKLIYPENKKIIKSLKKAVSRHLPGMKDYYLAEDYGNAIQALYKEKKITKTEKDVAYPFEIAAENLLREIVNNEDVKAMKADQNKIDLLLNCVDLVDCLPQGKFNRSTKFKYKSKIYQAAYKVAEKMGEQDLVQKYFDESERFANAYDQALSHAHNYDVQQKIRNARNWDDYFNK
jgi:cytochrome oxidase Cu insertion factor (SCO1/SenC/PrrC family)